MLKSLCDLIKNDNVNEKIRLKKVDYIAKILGKRINERYRGRNPLSWAVECGEDAIIEVLEKHGAVEDCVTMEEQEELNDDLIEAVNKRNYRDVLDLVEKGASVDAIGVEGDTALMAAIRKDRMKVVDLFIQEGCNVNQKNFDENNALSLAVILGKKEAVEKLIKAGANVNITDGQNEMPLMDACSYGNVEIAKILIDNGARVDHVDNEGNTVLMHAVGSPELIELLLEKGIDIDAQNNKEQTALILATDNCEYEGVECLLKAGADVTLFDETASTALMIAKRKRYKEIAKLIESYEEKNTSQIYGDENKELKDAVALEKKVLDRGYF